MIRKTQKVIIVDPSLGHPSQNVRHSLCQETFKDIMPITVESKLTYITSWLNRWQCELYNHNNDKLTDLLISGFIN